MQRRVFEYLENDVAIASHRTISEFLGAKWIASLVKKGLPINRVLSLMTIDGYPALELRGLFAWLPNFLPDHATYLIDIDPLAVTIYGDPRKLSMDTRKAIVSSISKHAKKDPWFYSDEIEQEPLGNLSGPDMTDEFRTILNATDTTVHLKVLILDAIINGPAMPDIHGDLISILENRSASYTLRERAFRAIISTTASGTKQVVAVTKNQLLHDPEDSEITSHIVEELYPNNFTPDDVSRLVSTILSVKGEGLFGRLWSLHENLPEKDIFEILDKLSDIFRTVKNVDWRSRGDATHFFSALLVRAFNSTEVLEAERFLYWMQSLSAIREEGGTGSSSFDSIITQWLKDSSGLVHQIYRISFDNFNSDRWWMFWSEFQRTIFDAYEFCLLYTSPSPRDRTRSRMPSSA